MLRSRQQEDANVGRIGQIFGAIDREMTKRRNAAAVPVFRAGVDQKDFRLLSGGDASAESVAPSGCRVGCGFVADREFSLCERTELVGLGEAFIETAKTGPAGLDKEGIDRLPPLLIGSESLVDQMALIASRLRGAVGEA